MSRSESSTIQKDENFDQVGKSFAGRFQIERQCGTGGFGVVYQAMTIPESDLMPPRVVAVKIFVDAMDLEDVKTEVLLQKSLEGCVNVPKIIDAGKHETANGKLRCWIAMDWINGHTLESYTKSSGEKLFKKPRAILNLLVPIFNALQLAHQGTVSIKKTPNGAVKSITKFCHSDLKPDNILIDETGTPWLLDFGMAKRLENHAKSRTASTALVRGAPAWLAPEQCSDQARSAKTDVHALGLILTWLLTRRMPYEAGSRDVIISLVKSENRPTPRSKGFNAGRWEGVISKALALNPHDRYPTAGQFLDELQKTIKDVPDEVRPFDEQEARLDQSRPPRSVSDDKAGDVKHDAPRSPGDLRDRILRFIPLPTGLLLVGLAAGHYMWSHIGRLHSDHPPTTGSISLPLATTPTSHLPVAPMPSLINRSLNVPEGAAPPSVPEPTVPNLHVASPVENAPTAPDPPPSSIQRPDGSSRVAPRLSAPGVPEAEVHNEASSPDGTSATVGSSTFLPLRAKVAAPLKLTQAQQAQPDVAAKLASNGSNPNYVSKQNASRELSLIPHADQNDKNRNSIGKEKAKGSAEMGRVASEVDGMSRSSIASDQKHPSNTAIQQLDSNRSKTTSLLGSKYSNLQLGQSWGLDGTQPAVPNTLSEPPKSQALTHDELLRQGKLDCAAKKDEQVKEIWKKLKGTSQQNELMSNCARIDFFLTQDLQSEN